MTPTDWKVLKQLLCYVQGTVQFGILLPMHNECTVLRAYSNADWARDKSTRRSRSGVLIFDFGATISWHSKLQKSTATSIEEAEFPALAL